MVDQEKYNEYSSYYTHTHGTNSIAQRKAQFLWYGAWGVFQDSTTVDKLDYACIVAGSHPIAFCGLHVGSKYENQHPNESTPFLLHYIVSYAVDFARLHGHLFAGPGS